MENDTEIYKEVWEGNVAVRFTLASHEVTSSGKSTPHYMMLPRNSYLPLINDKIKKHFSPFMNDHKDDEIWFDYNGGPLRWHYPVGVLFDIICGKNPQVPIDLTVHFQEFPEDNIMRCNQPEIVEAHFMSTLKEADQLKHRGQVMNNMNKTQHKQLWHSLRNNNFQQFWSVNCKLVEGPNSFKYIPIRVYHEDSVIQRLISPINDADSSEVTLHDCISEIFKYNLPDIEMNQFCSIIQGIIVEHNTPIHWLSEHLSYADNFLHIVLAKK